MTTLGMVLTGRANGKTAALPFDLASLVASLPVTPSLGNPHSLVATLEAWTNQDDDAHEPCSLTACRHPLHPGPCKGWKGTLHSVSPGTYKQLEEERVRKANDRRIKRIADLKAQGKPIPRRLLEPIKPKPAPTGTAQAVPLGKVNQQADLAGGQAHVASQAISNAAGVKPTTPLPLGPKGKKPAITKRGPAFLITQPKVTDQYKLDKAAKITPQEWDALPPVDKNAIRNELTAIKARGFGPQQTKADALLAKLPAPNTVGNTAAPAKTGPAPTPSANPAPGKVTLGQATKTVTQSPSAPNAPNSAPNAPNNAPTAPPKAAPAPAPSAANPTPVKVRADEVKVGDVVKGNMIPGDHKVAKIVLSKVNMRGGAVTSHDFYDDQGRLFFVGRSYAMARVVSKAGDGDSSSPTPSAPAAPGIPAPSTTPAVLSSDAQQARAVAGRAVPKAQMSKTQLDAYGKLSATDFGHLDARTQRIIRDDLANAKAKFLDPKKQQAAQDLLDRFGSRHPTPAAPALAPSASTPAPSTTLSGGRKTFTATHNGKTITRTSSQPYTHASVVRWSDGTEEVASFHTSEAAALKGVLTAQQKQNGAQVVKAVTVKVDTPAATGAKGYSDPMNEALKAVSSSTADTDDTLKAVGRLSPATVGQLTPADKKTVVAHLESVASHPRATPAQKARAAALKRIIEDGSPAQTSRTWDHAPTLAELHAEEEKNSAAKDALVSADALFAADASHMPRADRMKDLTALSKKQFDALAPDDQRKVTDALQVLHTDQKGQYNSTILDAAAADLIKKFTGLAPGMHRLRQAEADFRAGKIDAKALRLALLTARVQDAGSVHTPGSPGEALAKEATRIARDNPSLPLWLRSEMIDNPYSAPGGLYYAVALASSEYNWEPAPRLSNGDITAIFRPTLTDLAAADPIHAEAIKALRLHLISTGLKGDPGVPNGSPWSEATRGHLVDNFLHISRSDFVVPQDRMDEYDALPPAEQVKVRKVLSDRILSQQSVHAQSGTNIALRQLQGHPLTGDQLGAAVLSATRFATPAAFLDTYRKLNTAQFFSLPAYTQKAIESQLKDAQDTFERAGAVRTWTPQDNALKVFPAALADALNGRRGSIGDRSARNASDIANYGTKIINPLDRVRAYGNVRVAEFLALPPSTHSKIISDLDSIAAGTGSLGLRHNAAFTKDITLQVGTGLSLDQITAIGASNPAQPIPDASAANYFHKLSKADFDGLAPVYREAIDERIKSLPGADQLFLNAKFHPSAPQASPAGVTPTTAQANVPPHVQTALDVIYGVDPKSHTMARQLSAYGALRGSDFSQLNPQEQTHLLSDLSFIQTTAKGPSAAKAKLLIDRFTPAGTPSGQIPPQPIIPPANAIPGQQRYAIPLKGLHQAPAGARGKNGDKWITLPGGQRVWGEYGASGLLIQHVDPATGEKRYLMVQRGPAISDPGKWTFPGGASESKETPHQGATRETIEELGLKDDVFKDALVHGDFTYSVPNSTWKYTSVAVQVPTMIKPNLSTAHARAETSDAKWMTEAEIRALDTSGQLHHPIAGGQLEKNVMSLFPPGTPAAPGGQTLGQVVRPGPVTKRLKRLTLPAGGRQAPAQFNAWTKPHKPSKGKDLIADKAAFDAMRQKVKQDRKLYDGKTADGRLAAIGAMQGFDDTPTVVDKKEIDRLLATGDYIEAWRGVSGAGGGWSARSRGGSGGKTAKDINEEMRSGPAYYGKGIFGNGYYLATQRRVAEQYSDRTNGSLVRILIPKAAVTEKYDKVAKQSHANPRQSKAKGAGFGEISTFYDPGRFAAAKGIDGIEIEAHHMSPGGGAGHVAASGKPAFNWLNRSVLIIQKEPA